MSVIKADQCGLLVGSSSADFNYKLQYSHKHQRKFVFENDSLFSMKKFRECWGHRNLANFSKMSGKNQCKIAILRKILSLEIFYFVSQFKYAFGHVISSNIQ